MISKIEYGKIYYFCPEDEDAGGACFIKTLYPTSGSSTLWNSPRYEALFIKSPFRDERDMEWDGEERRKYHKWLESENIRHWNCENEFLKKRLFKIKDIETFPMCVEIGNRYHIAIGKDKAKRKLQLDSLLEE